MAPSIRDDDISLGRADHLSSGLLSTDRHTSPPKSLHSILSNKNPRPNSKFRTQNSPMTNVMRKMDETFLIQGTGDSILEKKTLKRGPKATSVDVMTHAKVIPRLDIKNVIVPGGKVGSHSVDKPKPKGVLNRFTDINKYKEFQGNVLDDMKPKGARVAYHNPVGVHENKGKGRFIRTMIKERPKRDSVGGAAEKVGNSLHDSFYQYIEGFKKKEGIEGLLA
jgi:hypothetical protein